MTLFFSIKEGNGHEQLAWDNWATEDQKLNYGMNSITYKNDHQMLRSFIKSFKCSVDENMVRYFIEVKKRQNMINSSHNINTIQYQSESPF